MMHREAILSLYRAGMYPRAIAARLKIARSSVERVILDQVKESAPERSAYSLAEALPVGAGGLADLSGE